MTSFPFATRQSSSKELFQTKERLERLQARTRHLHQLIKNSITEIQYVKNQTRTLEPPAPTLIAGTSSFDKAEKQSVRVCDNGTCQFEYTQESFLKFDLLLLTFSLLGFQIFLTSLCFWIRTVLLRSKVLHRPEIVRQRQPFSPIRHPIEFRLFSKPSSPSWGLCFVPPPCAFRGSHVQETVNKRHCSKILFKCELQNDAVNMSQSENIPSKDKSPDTSIQKEILTELPVEIMDTLTEEHARCFLSGLTTKWKDSVSSIAPELGAPSSIAWYECYCSDLPYHPLNEALFMLFRENLLQLEVNRQQAQLKGGIEKLRWTLFSEKEKFDQLYTNVMNKICFYKTEEQYCRGMLSDREVVDKLICQECSLKQAFPSLLVEKSCVYSSSLSSRRALASFSTLLEGSSFRRQFTTSKTEKQEENVVNSNCRTHFERRLVPYTREYLYEVVKNVDDYKYFVPWCEDSRVLWRRGNEMAAELTVGFKILSEKYTSHIILDPPNSVRVRSPETRLFEYLINEWYFKPGPDAHSTWLEFYVSFKFRSFLYQHVVDMFFEDVVKKMVSAFENRAKFVESEKILKQRRVPWSK
eukprot:jgi/Galph1/1355/GphlegSOOS_G5973.1